MSADPGPPHDPWRQPPGAAARFQRWSVFLAQGFGLCARLPAPGTWGSLLGLMAFAALAWPGSYPFYLAGTVFLLAVSVPICTAAELALGRKDPGSVVLDEMVAMPLCYLGWVTDRWLATGRCSLEDLLAQPHAWFIVGSGFLVFRCLDIAKPWPIRAVQSLPGGWGVMLDDILAALGTAAVVLLLTRVL